MNKLRSVAIAVVLLTGLIVPKTFADACFAWCLGDIWPRWCLGQCQVTGGDFVTCIHGDCFFDRTAICMKWNEGGGGAQFIHVNCRAQWDPFPYSPEANVSGGCDSLGLFSSKTEVQDDGGLSWVVFENIYAPQGERPEIYASSEIQRALDESKEYGDGLVRSARALLAKNDVETTDVRVWSITPPDNSKNFPASIYFEGNVEADLSRGFLVLLATIHREVVIEAEVLMDQAGAARDVLSLLEQAEVDMDRPEETAKILVMIAVDEGVASVAGTSAFTTSSTP